MLDRRRGTEEGHSESSAGTVANSSRASMAAAFPMPLSVGLGRRSLEAGPAENWEHACSRKGPGETLTVPLDRFPELLEEICGTPSRPSLPAAGPLWRWETRLGKQF